MTLPAGLTLHVNTARLTDPADLATIKTLNIQLKYGDFVLADLNFDPAFNRSAPLPTIDNLNSYHYHCHNGGFNWFYRDGVLRIAVTAEWGSNEIVYPCDVDGLTRITAYIWEALEQCRASTA